MNDVMNEQATVTYPALLGSIDKLTMKFFSWAKKTAETGITSDGKLVRTKQIGEPKVIGERVMSLGADSLDLDGNTVPIIHGRGKVKNHLEQAISEDSIARVKSTIPDKAVQDVIISQLSYVCNNQYDSGHLRGYDVYAIEDPQKANGAHYAIFKYSDKITGMGHVNTTSIVMYDQNANVVDHDYIDAQRASLTVPFAYGQKPPECA